MLKGFKTFSGVGGAPSEERLFDVVVAATDVPGIQKLLPADFRKFNEFDKVYNLETVPVQTVQLRFDGWVTELADMKKMKVREGDGFGREIQQGDWGCGRCVVLSAAVDSSHSPHSSTPLTPPSPPPHPTPTNSQHLPTHPPTHPLTGHPRRQE